MPCLRPQTGLCHAPIRWGARWLGLLGIALFTLACSAPESRDQIIRVWCHQGQEAENQAMRDMVDAFNLAHAESDISVDITFFPDYHYTEKVSIAAAAGDLPDVLDLDGPTVAQFAHAGLLHPIAEYFSAEELADFAPTLIAQGTVSGTLFALGAFDSAMVLYYDRSMFEAAGVDPPAQGEGWTWNEFLVACETLKSAGMDPVALHMDVTADEWYTYAFTPPIWSAGGRLIDENNHQVQGILNGAATVHAVKRWQELFLRDFASTSPIDPNPFGSGATAMDWNGHWMARAHLDAKGDHLGAMPLPRMGDTPAAACGSWCWAMTRDARNPDLAALWLRWVTDPVHGIEPIISANGAVPARASAFSLFPEYQEPPFSLFRTLQEQAGRPRPRTPYYPALTQHVAAALRDIARGAVVQTRLDQAAAHIQRIIDRKRGES